MAHDALVLLFQVDIFRPLPAEALLFLAGGSRAQRFPAGSRLMCQGDAGTHVHVIVRGWVYIEQSHSALLEPVVLGERGPGEILDELPTPDQALRSITVTATEDTETIELDAAVLAQATLHFPAVAPELRHALTGLAQAMRHVPAVAPELLHAVTGRPGSAGRLAPSSDVVSFSTPLDEPSEDGDP